MLRPLADTGNADGKGANVGDVDGVDVKLGVVETHVPVVESDCSPLLYASLKKMIPVLWSKNT